MEPSLTLKAIEHHQSDVLVIGAGAAGLRAAMAIQEQGGRALVVGKRQRRDAHTSQAAGGLNAALGTMDPEDTWAIHAADTLREGRFLGDPIAVELLCREAPRAVADLITYGVPFARESDGRLSQRQIGAHRYRRCCFVGDYIGRAMIDAMITEIDRRKISIIEGVYIVDLLLDRKGIVGALGFSLVNGAPLLFTASAVILATGGHINIYRRSSARPRESTGDGMALALRAGAQLADMELVQFHPTGMVWPTEAEGILVSEAVRGEGGRLFNARGERFMSRYDSARLELSTRDRVALANYTEIVEGRGTQHGGVWLDLTHLPAKHIYERLPNMVAQFQTYGGIDITRQPMEVAPTVHYSMGGIRVEPYTHATNISGLFAAGEVAAGVHGANRLGGNSLSECLVFGRRAGEAAMAYINKRQTIAPDMQGIAERLSKFNDLACLDTQRLANLIEQLQQLTWLHAGMIRDATGLITGIAKIEDLRTELQELSSEGAPNAKALAAALDLDNMLLTAEATVRAALLRTESRGAHQRRDYPNTAPEWQCTIVTTLETRKLVLSTNEIASPSPEVIFALADTKHQPVIEGLLE